MQCTLLLRASLDDRISLQSEEFSVITAVFHAAKIPAGMEVSPMCGRGFGTPSGSEVRFYLNVHSLI